MSKPVLLTLVFVLCIATLLCSTPSLAEQASPVVVLRETGLPSADSPVFPQSQLDKAMPGARFVPADQLGSALGESATRLLVLPHGSVFSEDEWPVIRDFLQHGGNLLVLG